MIDVQVDVDQAQLAALEGKLGNLKSKAPTVLYRALNRAAAAAKTEAKRDIAQEYYISQKNAGETMSISKASTAKLSAELRSKGGPIALTKFKYSPKRAVRHTKKGYSPSVYSAGVEQSGGLKPLSGDPKAFIASFKSGHTGLMEREGSSRLPIKQLYGPAVPSMMKNERVIGKVQEKAMETLEKRLDAEVNNILQRGR